MKRKPFISIVGFTQPTEIELVEQELSLDNTHRFMVGVVMDKTCIEEGANITRRRTADPSMVKELFTRKQRHLNVIQYSTSDPHNLQEQLSIVAKLGGRHLDGFLLKNVWPDPKVTEWLHDKLPGNDPSQVKRGTEVSLLINSSALSVANRGDPRRVAECVGEYHGTIDYAIIVCSEGKPMDLVYLRELFNGLQEAHSSWLNFGIKDGINLNALDSLAELLTTFPDLSISMEHQLRTRDDILNIESVHRFLTDVTKLVTKPT